jgi:quinol monooxygenase YgiN
MAVVVLIDIVIKSGERAAAERLFADALAETRAFPGCIDIYVARSLDDADALSLVEVWDTRESQGKYMAWRMTTDFGAKLTALLAAAPRLQFLEKLDF